MSSSLPASPDGRDLAPRLARCPRPAVVGGRDRGASRRSVVRSPRRFGHRGSRRRRSVRGHAATGCARRAEPVDARAAGGGRSHADRLDPSAGRRRGARRAAARPGHDGSRRGAAIVGGGAGLDAPRRGSSSSRASPSALGASVGATACRHRPRLGRPRPPDRHHRRRRRPELYVAFGISGAVQHTSGLGAPDHIISVNTDRTAR